MPPVTVTVKVYPPEFRWGEAEVAAVGSFQMIRGLAVSDDMTFNATTQRYISLGSPLASAGTSTAVGSTFRALKPHTLHSLAILFETVLPGGASATFQFNVNGSTRAEIILTATAGEQDDLAVGELDIAIDDMVCLECTATAGAVPNIQSISYGLRTMPGADPTV